jgi:hypothetical protein
MKTFNLKYYLFFLLFGSLVMNIQGQSIVYVDPTWTGSQNGTQANPYKTFPSFAANTTYLLKTGTTYNITGTIGISVNNVTLGAYGTGTKPKIYNGNNAMKTILVNASNCRITGLSIEMYANVPDGTTNANSGTGNICLLYTEGVYQPYTLIVDNCDIKGGTPGINGYKVRSIRVLNCDISNTVYDANYSEFVDTVIYKNTNIHDAYVNVNNSNLIISIDLLHVKHTYKLIVDNCILNHSNAPGKYCIIYHKDDYTTYAHDSLIATNSRFMGSVNPLNYGSCVKPSVSYARFANCIFSDAARFMQTPGPLDIDNCLFTTSISASAYAASGASGRGEGVQEGIQGSTPQVIKNSTFIGVSNPLYGGTLQNCLFWNCTGNGQGTIWANSTTNPNFDANYNATGTLFGVGYTSNPGGGTTGSNLALNKTAVASSVYNDNVSFAASKAVDGNATGTRWVSSANGANWIYVDLGASYSVSSVILTWTTTGYGKDYKIQVSSDASTWRDVYTVTGNTSSGSKTYNFTTTTCRYVRMNGTALGTGVSQYNLWEFEVYSIVKSAQAGMTVTDSPANIVSVYPNPAKGFVNVEVQESCQARIIDQEGRVIIREILEPGVNRIRLNVNPGMYLVEIKKKDKSIMKKIMVK